MACDTINPTTNKGRGRHGPSQQMPSMSFTIAKVSASLALLLMIERSDAFAPIRMTSTAVYAASFPTQLEYRTNSDADTSVKTSRWWSPILFSSGVVKPSTSDDKSRAVDDYLEFLERRYHRIHDDEQDQTRPSTGSTKFSALKWLKQESEVESPEVQQQQKDDALFVLGVAGLASRQLLMKHGRAHPPSDSLQRYGATTTEHPSKVASFAALKSEASLPASSAIVYKALDRLQPLARHVLVRRKLLLRYQARQLNAMAAVLAKALATGPAKAASALWHMGGGRKNIAVTLTVMAAFSLFVLRPLTEFLLAVQHA